MEFAFRSRQAMAAPDDVETGRLRSFSDLPPPPYGDANASPVNAALARKREELLRELNKVRNRQDLILREIVETEHAMGLIPTGYSPVPTLPSSQDYASSVNPLEEKPPLPPRSSTDHPPSFSMDQGAMRAPPVYPHLEWLVPSPLLQPRLASDTEKQQDSMSFGARMHLFDGYAATTDGARPTFREGAPGHKDAAGGEQKDGVKEAHSVHRLYEIGNQSSEQRKTAEITLIDQINGAMMSSSLYRLGGQESVAFHQRNGREFSAPTPELPRLGDGPQQQQEFRSSGFGAHVFSGYAETSKQAPVRETLVPVAAKVGEVASGHLQHLQAFCGEPKAEVEDGHHVQPFGEIRNNSSGEERKAVESAMGDRTDEPTRLPGQHRPAGLDNAAYNEQKSVHENTSAGVKRKLNAAASPSKKQKPLGKNSCAICGVNTPSPRNLEEHLVGKMHKWNVTAMLQARRNGTTEPNTEAAPVQNTTAAMNAKSYQNGKGNVAAGSSGSKQGGAPHFKSFAHHRKDADMGKKADWKIKFYCKLCDAQCNSETMLASHLEGKKHREKLLEGGSV